MRSRRGIRREVTERDGGRCTFVDEHGNRCTAREHLTIEHRHPHAKGGEPSTENLCLLCSAHNLDSARKAFGKAHVDKKILESEYERTRKALCNMGFREAEVRKALANLKKTSRATRARDLIVEALALLVPPSTKLKPEPGMALHLPVEHSLAARQRSIAIGISFARLCGLLSITLPARLRRHWLPRPKSARRSAVDRARPSPGLGRE